MSTFINCNGHNPDIPIKEHSMKHSISVIVVALAVAFSSPCYAQNQQKPATLRSILMHELVTTHN